MKKRLLTKSLDLGFFNNLEGIGGAYEIKEFKQNCFKTVRNIKKCYRVDAHYLVAHPLHLKMIGINLSVYGLQATYISCVWKRSETHAKEFGSVLTASIHISCILRWLGILRWSGCFLKDGAKVYFIQTYE